jgi:hypothetical protein
MARPVRLIALSFAASAAAAPVASAAIPRNDQWDYRILTARGTITFTAAGEWFDGYTRDLDGNPLNTKGSITIVNTWRKAKPSTQSLTLGQIRRFPSSMYSLALRGVVGTSTVNGSGTSGDGAPLTCTAAVPLTRRFFSDSATNDMFLHFRGRGRSVNMFLRGGYPTYPTGETTVPPDCGRMITGLGMRDADEKRPTLIQSSFFRRKRGAVITFVVTQSMPVRATKIDGEPIVGSVTWRSTFKMRLVSFS